MLFTYLHLAPDPEQTKDLVASGATCIAYETVTDEHGQLPLLKPMSQVAGRMSVQAGASALEKAHGGRGVLLGGHAGKDVILYANGKSIVIRSLAGEGTKLLQWPPPNVHSTRQEPRINYAELYSLLFLCISRHH